MDLIAFFLEHDFKESYLGGTLIAFTNTKEWKDFFSYCYKDRYLWAEEAVKKEMEEAFYKAFNQYINKQIKFPICYFRYVKDEVPPKWCDYGVTYTHLDEYKV
jgi:hypothetical protein